ncbi:MAG TPA: hypothetical protein VMY78_09100 [Solirubrobacteraceae bacterium]|nr:hypothetical protein [Solirubrobacteraceae bacterium]
MPLDWEAVKRRYENGAEVPTVAGNKTLDVTGADDEAIYIRGGRLWTAALQRSHLELAAELIELGELSRTPVAFVEEYHARVAPERGTSVAHILKDFGFIE